MYKLLIQFVLFSLLSAQTPDVLLQNGLDMFNNGDLEGAQAALEDALQFDPTFAPAMIALSKMHLHNGDMQKTQEYIRKAIDAEPENQDYREEFERLNEINTLMADGQRNMQTGNLSAAYESYRIVLEKFPFFAEAPYSMGLIKYYEGDFEEALKHFNQALALNPFHEKSMQNIFNIAKKKFNFASQAYKNKDFEGALDNYVEVLKIDKTFYQAHYQIGRIKSIMGDESAAIEHYLAAIEILPTFYIGYYSMGRSQRAIDDIAGAIKSMESAIEINPRSSSTLRAPGFSTKTCLPSLTAAPAISASKL